MNMILRIIPILSLLSIALLSGCAGTAAKTESRSDDADKVEPAATPQTVRIYAASEPIKGKLRKLPGSGHETFHQALRQVLHNLGESEPTAEVFNELAQQVDTYIETFQGSRHGWYQKALQRGQKYLPMIHALFQEKKIPREMAWLAMIESGFQYTIRSHAGARGMWQFMPATARDYGLHVSRSRDDRVDPYHSALAAREYLLDMVAVYGSDSFLLVAASYNAGEGAGEGGRCARSMTPLPSVHLCIFSPTCPKRPATMCRNCWPLR